MNPEHYQQQLDKKIDAFKQQLNTLALCLPEVAFFASPKRHYRLRAEFTIWHEGDSARYAMHDKETKKPIFIEEFPVACQRINELMPTLLAAINDGELLRKKLFQVEFLSTLTEDTVISLIYHKPLNEEWQDTMRPLKQALGVQIIGRSRKQKVVLDRDYVNETLKVHGKTYHYQQNEGSFTQPNGIICEKMLEWAVEHTRGSHGDLLELYCGNGNFSLPLAQNFTRVMATEISKSSVKAAQNNIFNNGVDNVTIIRMSSEDFADAMDKVRPFHRLRNIDLDNYHFSTVLVDPPRAGLDDHTIEIIQRFERILYISCNPETLVNNLQQLLTTHTIISLAAFDQFPYTHHLEAGVILERKKTS